MPYTTTITINTKRVIQTTIKRNLSSATKTQTKSIQPPPPSPPPPPPPPPSTSSILQTFTSSVLLTLPVFVWCTDKLYATVTIVGSSMEPTLYEGDVVLIRKSDLGLAVKYKWRDFFQKTSSYFFLGKFSTAIGSSSKKKSQEEEEKKSEEEEEDEEEEDLAMISTMDATAGKFPSGWVSYPPLVRRGDVVVYQDPNCFPVRWNVKRVIGLGGQRVRPSKEWQRFQSIPSYSLWVEGDNLQNSTDSNTTGPISKKLLIGVAETIVWPPSRWKNSVVERIVPARGRSWWV